MRMIRLNYISQLTYLPLLFPVNCYLVEEKDGLTLVDAALPNNTAAILKAAEHIGKPITRIALTHAHSDHVGALDRLKRLLPNIDVYISARDARLLHSDTSLNEDEGNLPIRGGVPKGIVTQPNVLLADNGRVGSLIAIAAPGHTPGSMAYIDERTGILIAGDAFQTRSGVTVCGRMKLSFPFPALATWDPAESIKTARRLAALKPAVLAAGHGNMVQSPLPAMQAAIIDADNSLHKKGRTKHVTKSGS